MARFFQVLAWFHVSLALALLTIASLAMPQKALASPASCQSYCQSKCNSSTNECYTFCYNFCLSHDCSLCSSFDDPQYTDCIAASMAGCDGNPDCLTNCANQRKPLCINTYPVCNGRCVLVLRSCKYVYIADVHVACACL